MATCMAIFGATSSVSLGSTKPTYTATQTKAFITDFKRTYPTLASSYTPDLIALGENVCSELGSGKTPTFINQEIVSSNPSFPEEAAEALLISAARDLCSSQYAKVETWAGVLAAKTKIPYTSKQTTAFVNDFDKAVPEFKTMAASLQIQLGVFVCSLLNAGDSPQTVATKTESEANAPIARIGIVLVETISAKDLCPAHLRAVTAWSIGN